MKTLRRILAVLAFVSLALGLVNVLMAGNEDVSKWLCGSGFVIMLTIWLYDKMRT